MKERPILFSAPMVRALLAGTKTQTRRVAKGVHIVHANTGEALARLDSTGPRILCPYGVPGDRLWVREAWQADPTIDDTWASTAWNGCKDSRIADLPERFHHPRFVNYRADWLHGDIIWRPSIHMPRWASRILLEVTDVRVERLQDISQADALAEGIVHLPRLEGYGLPDGSHFHCTDPRISYWSLWDAINGQGATEANPWVWAVSFNRVSAQ